MLFNEDKRRRGRSEESPVPKVQGTSGGLGSGDVVGHVSPSPFSGPRTCRGTETTPESSPGNRKVHRDGRVSVGGPSVPTLPKTPDKPSPVYLCNTLSSPQDRGVPNFQR